MEAVGLAEMFVLVYRTTRCYMPKKSFNIDVRFRSDVLVVATGHFFLLQRLTSFTKHEFAALAYGWIIETFRFYVDVCMDTLFEIV